MDSLMLQEPIMRAMRPKIDDASPLASACAAIRRHWNRAPDWAIVLGTGLGGLTQLLDVEAEIPYTELPGFPRSTALAHKGMLVCGTLCGRNVAMLQGRSHVYEGHPFERLMFPTRVLAQLGASRILLTNAAGGMNPQFGSGDVMVIDDHINFMFQNERTAEARPAARNLATAGVGPRREFYDRELLHAALEAAMRHGIPARRGVYVGVTGPNYETRAEYRMFRRLGGDAVGMSTIPEVLAAAQCGMRVLGFSAITNVAKPDAPEAVDAEEVVDVALHAAPKIQAMIVDVLSNVK